MPEHKHLVKLSWFTGTALLKPKQKVVSQQDSPGLASGEWNSCGLFPQDLWKKEKFSVWVKRKKWGLFLTELPFENLPLKQHYMAIILPATDMEKERVKAAWWWLLSDADIHNAVLSRLCVGIEVFSFYIKHCLKSEYTIVKLCSTIQNV